MADVPIQLNRQYVSAGSVVTATGGPYTVASDGTITVLDSNEATVRTELSSILEPAGAASQPTRFLVSLPGLLADSLTRQPLLSCPAGKTAVVTKVIARGASAEVGSLFAFGIGWDNDSTDVVVPAAPNIRIDSTFYYFVPLLASTGDNGCVGGVGGTGSTLGVTVTVAASGGTTFTLEVEGYFV